MNIHNEIMHTRRRLELYIRNSRTRTKTLALNHTCIMDIYSLETVLRFRHEFTRLRQRRIDFAEERIDILATLLLRTEHRFVRGRCAVRRIDAAVVLDHGQRLRPGGGIFAAAATAEVAAAGAAAAASGAMR